MDLQVIIVIIIFIVSLEVFKTAYPGSSDFFQSTRFKFGTNSFSKADRYTEPCKLIPQMHDLATFVSGHESIMMDRDKDSACAGLRRVSLDYSLDILSGIPNTSFREAKKITEDSFARHHSITASQ